MKQRAFAVLTAAILGAIFAVLIGLTLPYLKTSLHDQLLQAVALTLTEEEREELYRQVAATSRGIWEVVPDPLVARIAQRNIVATRAQAEVRTNNAGFRSSKPFKQKDPDKFRIVCLGDSFVFGQAGLEEDRFCDQIEAFYRDRGITVEGKAIETYAVGIGGWTAVQEATYLSTRISAYEADVVIVLTVANDITDSFGVTGRGVATVAFSPEHRDWGSAVFSAQAGDPFLMGQPTTLATDLCPEARARWRKAMGALRRLSEVQTRRGGRVLNSVSLGPGDRARYFVEMYKQFYSEHGPATPFVITSYFRGKDTKLPHDPHPNRRGHAIYASHYIHLLDHLEWISVSEDRLPPLDPRLSLETDPAPNLEKLNGYRREFIRAHLRPSLDFAHLDRRNAMAFLGGILPEEIGARALDAPPWASVRSGFVLRRRRGPRRAASAVVEIDVPPLAELFPMRVEMFLDGRLAETFDYAEPGRYALEAPLEVPGERVVEIVLRTSSYFCEIDDHRMKSFQLISAEIRDR